MKIVTIGGGSSYTPEIIEGFINRHKNLPVSEIWLVDIEAGKKKLETVGRLAQRMVEKAGINCKVHLTLNRREALKGASFVTTQFRVGLMEARILDERIPLSHGMIGQETNGFGGFMKALRTIPVILDIAKDMEELCPNAWLINFTNPSSMVTEAVQRFSKIKCVGLCNVPIYLVKTAEQMLGDSNFLLHCVGMNHYLWARHLYYKGNDILPEKLADFVRTTNESEQVRNVKNIPWDVNFVQHLGMMPVSYHRYYYMTEQMLEEELTKFDGGKGKTRGQEVKEVEEKLFKLYEDPDLAVKPKELEERGGTYYSDAACDLIQAIYTNNHQIMIVNTQNNGTLPFLPDDATIETSAMITDAGPIPLKATALPIIAQTELHIMKTFERLTIEAAISGNYDTAIQALTLNPLVKKGEITRQVLNEMIQAHKAHLPKWQVRK
ncbi:6-phospho-beta-glucosidase [Entomospira culicis]|uniref:6-phospho-beta-glucosidase n=1 Tax=Entomospira culicis TaxID=2719989 RepID=A0A968GEC4_9SPIO|nr:6-phospho-beta-glucosidase [Entomospira culicis]NIZ18743.1 6-phospho-beta-glucosidase [Entomospira culicis]NIZ68958.1 6-phospho-beta-glucosidase [Entomospira culicis]WDI37550.1 6-phospho-beta-glucosidase [Entomospira culicis]WDI39178.1 6-phospho-beta-glucosidase [Entomospira culicis]